MLRGALALPLTVAAVVVTLVLTDPGPVLADDKLQISSTITYDVQTSDVPVRATWDVSIANNDPETQPDGSGTLAYYHTVNLPVIRGASAAKATDSAGQPLGVYITDVGSGVAESAAIAFADPLFFGESYSFRLSYILPSARSEGILVTSNYAYLPLITAGDESTVIVNTPPGDPWQTTIEARECASTGATFSCSGSDNAYVAATVEVLKPAAITRTTFPVEMESVTLQVELAYLQGEDSAATHQRDLLSAALPLAEEVYGVPYDGPVNVSVSHGGRQSVLGYEGLATCSSAGCELVISPVADDYTVLHETAHMWSDLYTKRWLAEGFAELVAHEVVGLLPPGLFVGTVLERRASGANLQLDDWGAPGSIIGADAAEVAVIETGYDYSLRFLQELRSTYGLDMLRSVNRSIVATGPADSRRFMDLVEDATGEELDAEFLLWVFPESYRPVLADRRQAHNRLESLKERLAAENLAPAPLVSIEQQVTGWQFKEALTGIEQLETNLETYADLSSQMEQLQRDAAAADLVLSDDIAESLNRFDFNAATNLMASSRRALDLYIAAQAKVSAHRSEWMRFGLLGNDPSAELRDAAEAFQEGRFTDSAKRSEDVAGLIASASETAMRRLLLVGAFLSLMALCVGIAVTYSRLRYRLPQA
ncbi:MAG: hypothetical protein ABIU97_10090 [Dehalococcoidia bacterium]